MRNNPTNGKIISARLPQDREEFVQLGLSPMTMEKIVQAGRWAAVAEYVGLLLKDGVLEEPAAIFQGLRRPFFSEGQDNFVYVYVTNPCCNYCYVEGDRLNDTGPHETNVPKSSVFTVFVSMAPADIDGFMSQDGLAVARVRGVILSWEWTSAGVDKPHLPDFYNSRYRRNIWPRP